MSEVNHRWNYLVYAIILVAGTLTTGGCAFPFQNGILGMRPSTRQTYKTTEEMGRSPSDITPKRMESQSEASKVPKISGQSVSAGRPPFESSYSESDSSVRGQLESTALPRNRESLVTKEDEESQLQSNYEDWMRKQKKEEKEKSSTPRYLQPLTDDRSVFDDPNSPFARKIREEGGERRFVRQITAADLSMMSQYSSTRELMDWEKDTELPVNWEKYSAKSLWNKWRDAIGMGPSEQEAIALMKQACVKQLEFEETENRAALIAAAALYERAVKKWPDSVLQEDALFHAGECRFFAGEYTKALDHYSQLVTRYSNSILKGTAMHRLYMIGCYWVDCSEKEAVGVNLSDSGKPRFSSFAGAKKAFEAVFMNDASDKGLAPDALYALANAYMRRGVQQGDASFESAARYYRQLYEFYPGCKHAEDAYQMAMLALHKSYQGALYDDKPLRAAKEIAEAAQRSGRGDKELILEELANIKQEQAIHLWTRGQYYEKQGHFASARSYYNRLVQEFPTNELAVEAAKKYDAIKDAPPEADQFAWIRPIAPFLPKPRDDYYEEKPSAALEELVKTGTPMSNTGSPLEFSQLEQPNRK